MRRFVCSVVVFVTLNTACVAQDDLYPRYAFQLTRVIDADTLEGDLILPGEIQPDRRVRLDCIQAAERGTAEGKRLKALVQEWIDGRTVLISHLDDGGFGRILARVHVPGWGETLSQRLYREEGVPLYRGTQTTISKIMACRARMER